MCHNDVFSYSCGLLCLLSWNTQDQLRVVNSAGTAVDSQLSRTAIQLSWDAFVVSGCMRLFWHTSPP